MVYLILIVSRVIVNNLSHLPLCLCLSPSLSLSLFLSLSLSSFLSSFLFTLATLHRAQARNGESHGSNSGNALHLHLATSEM